MALLSGGAAQASDDDGLLRALEAAVHPSNGAASPEETPSPHLWIHGANLDLQPGAFQSKIEDLLQETRSSVTFVGRYDHEQLSGYMSNVDWVVVPSVWWENSPLVIQEAFHFGRPVICSNHGGMAEKVSDGLNGLHFQAGDAADLARTLERAAGSSDLWGKLRAGVRPVYSMDEHVAALTNLYEALREERSAVGVG